MLFGNHRLNSGALFKTQMCVISVIYNQNQNVELPRVGRLVSLLVGQLPYLATHADHIRYFNSCRPFATRCGVYSGLTAPKWQLF